MNVSVLNIDVGNSMALTSSTWSIPNISIPPIPQIPLINKCMCLRGQEAHLKSHQRLIPNQNFRVTSSLILVAIQSCPRNPLGKVNSQPSIFHQDLRLMWALKSMSPKVKSVLSQEPIKDCDELYASLPLVQKEKVTGPHHQYASKPRTAHASSSREKNVEDEDEKMSPNHSEKNDEPRRYYFMAHEEGTQSNCEFTHPQMPLAQSMLEQSGIRQQRNQACKAHNVPKHASQKEQQRWLKAELPENGHAMRAAVHAHCLSVLKVRDKDFSSLQAPPSTEECEIEIQVDGHLGYVPKDVFNEP
ncbi:hypothetical protein O181_074855 [Austropuccinia psidii MF-1]|uniref:Uncharacterized protein n=1 Tax=Austropuccinia psidii MF-1 TaxID=1389203 RepID=A0A9Q3F5F2_9BASI|nr:hypothetical protein [Austropuccinia psidii MF-1]